MAKEIIYRCDKAGCNLTRPAISETNHWFSVSVNPGITIDYFIADALQTGDKIFCGEAHALEYIAIELPKLHPTRERSESGKRNTSDLPKGMCMHGNDDEYCIICSSPFSHGIGE